MTEQLVSTPEYKLAMEHAWAWFTVHANQRMQLVNFWLIAMAFLTAALASTLGDGRWPIGLVVALAGSLSTAAFHRLDRRTRELVNLAESALLHFQQDLANFAEVPELNIVAASNNHARLLGSYSQIILFLHSTAFLGFAGAAGYAALKIVVER